MESMMMSGERPAEGGLTPEKKLELKTELDVINRRLADFFLGEDPNERMDREEQERLQARRDLLEKQLGIQGSK